MRIRKRAKTSPEDPQTSGQSPSAPLAEDGNAEAGPGSQDVLDNSGIDCSIGCGGSRANPFPYGQCTYHGYETRADIYDHATSHGQPAGGWNGYVWASRAAAVGFAVDGTPRPGALAVFSREYFGGPKNDNAGGQYGHVGYVKSVNGDGSFLMSERNWRGNPNITEHTYRPRAGIQFVHGLGGATQPSPPPTYASSPGGRDLFFAKTKNTGTGHVELHSATSGSGFQGGQHSVTWFSPADADNGWFQTVGTDLFLVKTRNTGSGMVEVHSATAGSGYRSGQHSVSWLSPGDATNGWFQMVGKDLYFIKTRNTGSGHVEVHTATAGSDYKNASVHAVSWLSPGDASNGFFQMVGADLYFVKTRNTGSGHVEVHSATASSGYKSAGQHSATWLSTGDASNGWFQMAGSDLFFVKTKNVGSGHVEVHSATAASGYQNGEHTVTWFSPGDANNGWFQVAGTKG